MEIKRYFEARKTISSKKEGEFEINKIHVIRLENKEALDYFYDVVEDNDDYESLYFDGFIMSWDDLYSVDVDKALEFIEGRIKEINEEGSDYEKEFLERIESVCSWLKKYEGYDLIIKEEDDNDKNHDKGSD